MNPKGQLFVFDVAVLLILAICCTSFGLGSLLDLDLGWHLAGGLWMLEKQSVPKTDFLGTLGTPWVAYSWLFECALGAVFRAAGFYGLQFLQYLLVYFSIAFLYIILVQRFERPGAHVLAALLVFLAFPLLAPFWHLRPQVLSVIFFIFAFSRSSKQKGFSADLVFLTILWANIHVFWVFVPLLAILFSTTRKSAVKSGALFCCGLCSPYGISNLSVLFDYGFKHQVGYSLIDEFRPLGPEVEFFLLWWALSLLAILLLSKSFLRAERWRFLVVAIVFAAVSFYQRKYLPYFAVATSFALFEVLHGRLQVSLGEPRSLGIVCGLLGILLLIYFQVWERSTPLSARTAALLEIVQITKAVQGAETSTVLNEFDDGGWLGLAFLLSNSRARTSIDGRTLVWGQARLQEYFDLLQHSSDQCEIWKRWKLDLAILPEHSLLRETLRACAPDWSLLREVGGWQVFGKSRLKSSGEP